MQTIHPIRLEDANEPTRRLLETVNDERHFLPNMIQTMARSPRTLEGYLQFYRALAAGKLTPELREQIALTVAQANGCEYSITQYAAQDRQFGLSSEEILASCDGNASDTKTLAALQFARGLAARRNDVSVLQMRQAGFSDSEMVEIVGHVALNLFENYFNTVVHTAPDFAIVETKGKAA